MTVKTTSLRVSHQLTLLHDQWKSRQVRSNLKLMLKIVLEIRDIIYQKSNPSGQTVSTTPPFWRDLRWVCDVNAWICGELPTYLRTTPINLSKLRLLSRLCSSWPRNTWHILTCRIREIFENLKEGNLAKGRRLGNTEN